MAKRKTGTREWSAYSQNLNRILHKGAPSGDRLMRVESKAGGIGGTKLAKCSSWGGCVHDCRYCYARAALAGPGMFGRGHKIDWTDWADPRRHVLDVHEAVKPRRHRDGVTMFPTAHDIWPALAGSAAELGHAYEQAGSPLLVVTKPHIEVVADLTHSWASANHRGLIAFRFTITTLDPDLMAYWEPCAPALAERLDAARLAVGRGFKVSFSVEPLLDVETTPRLVALLHEVSPQGEIWVGAMRKASERVKVACEADSDALSAIQADQTNGHLEDMVMKLAAAPPSLRRRVRWKDSIQQVMCFDDPRAVPGGHE